MRSRIAVLVVLGLAACGGGGSSEGPRASGAPAASAPSNASVPSGATSGSLSGTEWEALALGGSAITSAPAPTLSFQRSGQVSASGGCNTFTGSVSVGNGGISFNDAFAGTSRACSGDLETRDRSMVSALQSATSFSRQGDRLTLFDAAGAPVALLLPAL